MGTTQATTYQDKVVVITGAGQGIGRFLAGAYAQREAINILIDRNPGALSETKIK